MARVPDTKGSSELPGFAAEAVVWKLFVPQIFAALVFVLIAQAGGFKELALLNLIVFFYLLAAAVAAHLRPYALGPTRLNAHMLTLVIGICAGSLFLNAPSNLGVFAPLACYFAVLLPLRISGWVGVRIAATVAGGAIVYLGMLRVLQIGSIADEGAGAGALLLVLAIVCGRWLMVEASGDLAQENEVTGVHHRSVDPSAGQRIFWAESIGEDPIREEVLSDLVWRLPIVVLMVGGVTLSVALLTSQPSIMFGVAWILVALYELWVFNHIPKQIQLRKLHGLSFLSCLGIVMWWGLLPIFEIGSRTLTAVILGATLGLIIALPWNKLWRSLVLLLALLLSALWATNEKSPALFLLWTMFVMAVSYRASALQYLQILARSAIFSLLGFLERGPRAVDCVWAFAGHAAALFDVKKVLVLYERSHAEFVENGKVNPAPEQLRLHGEAVRAALKSSPTMDGFHVVANLGEQVTEAFEQWFDGRLPKKFAFARLPGVLSDENEEEAHVVVPIYRSVSVLGVFRIFRHFVVLSGVGRSWLAATRSKARSSDVLLGTQQALNTKEEEFNETVHQVNNVAQEIAVQVDALKRKLNGSAMWSDEIERILMHLEGGSRHLSSGVSDRKRLRELLQLRELSGNEVLNCDEIVEELAVMCRYLSERGNKLFEVDPIDRGLAVRVASKEYLETTLRLLLQLCDRSPHKATSLRIRISHNDSRVSFEFRTSDSGWDIASLDRIVKGISKSTSAHAEILQGAGKVASVSNGALEVSKEGNDDIFTLTLPRAEAKSVKIEPSGQWVLFVDDNPQVTAFYGKVAEALGLRYRSASSVEEARAILDTHGRPRLVVTDIRLGEGSGLDLVRHIRQSFGKELPVVVVSGETAGEVAAQVAESGATRFLSKPLGRGKLVAEIQQVLA